MNQPNDDPPVRPPGSNDALPIRPAETFRVGLGDRGATLTAFEWGVLLVIGVCCLWLPHEYRLAGPILTGLPIIIFSSRFSRRLILGIDGFRLGDHFVPWAQIEDIRIERGKAHRLLRFRGRGDHRSWTFTCVHGGEQEALVHKAAFDAVRAEAALDDGSQDPYRSSQSDPEDAEFRAFAIAAMRYIRDGHAAPEPLHSHLIAASAAAQAKHNTTAQFVAVALITALLSTALLSITWYVGWNGEPPARELSVSVGVLTFSFTAITTLIAVSTSVLEEVWSEWRERRDQGDEG